MIIGGVIQVCIVISFKCDPHFLTSFPVGFIVRLELLVASIVHFLLHLHTLQRFLSIPADVKGLSHLLTSQSTIFLNIAFITCH